MNVYGAVKHAGIGFMLLGLLVMLGWVANIPLLKTPIPNAPVMKFFTAMAIFFGGVLLRASYRLVMHEKQEMAQLKVMIAACFLLMISFPLAVAFFMDVDTGFETFGMENALSTHNPVPNVGTIAGMWTLFLLALGVALGFSISRFSLYGGLALIGIGGLALAGYVVQEPTLYFLSGRSEGMAFHTAASFVLMGYFFFTLGIRPHSRETNQPAEVSPRAHGQ